MTDLLPDPDRPDWRTRVCRDCGAGWHGHQDDDPDWCPWCERSLERLKADQRTLLLDPAWLRSNTGTAHYDALDDVSRAVWDATRHQTRGTDSIITWTARLARAVTTRLITQQEADRALHRATRLQP